MRISDQDDLDTSHLDFQSSRSFHFLAYCLHVTLRAQLKLLNRGLAPRAVRDKRAAIQMLAVVTRQAH